MTKEQFIEELKGHLSSLPREELDSAVKYYEEYLEDSEDVEEAIKSLGSPKSVAGQILSDMGRTEEPTTENVPAVTGEVVKEKKKQKKEKRPLTALETVLIIILCVITSPLWLGLALTLLGLFIALVAVVFALLISIAAVSLALVVAGCAGFVAGIAMIFGGTVGGGCTLVGGSLLCLAIGILLAIPGWAIIVKVIPALFRGIVNLFRKIFHIRKKGE